MMQPCLSSPPPLADTYLLTYTLDQGDNRKARRGTIWRGTSAGWQIVYHQGAFIQDTLM